jgi:hypothetical protein
MWRGSCGSHFGEVVIRHPGGSVCCCLTFGMHSAQSPPISYQQGYVNLQAGVWMSSRRSCGGK